MEALVWDSGGRPAQLEVSHDEAYAVIHVPVLEDEAFVNAIVDIEDAERIVAWLRAYFQIE